jgi:hypothetical protein
MTDKTNHPAVDHLLDLFAMDHLPEDLAAVAGDCRQLAYGMASTLPSNPELTAGLRKLLEAKDCFVRARVAALRANQDAPAGR